MAAENVPIKVLWQGGNRDGYFVCCVNELPADAVQTLTGEPPEGKEHRLTRWMAKLNPNGSIVQTVDSIPGTVQIRYSVVDAWECSRCKSVSRKIHTDAHFNSRECLAVDRQAALEAAGYTKADLFPEVQRVFPVWGWDPDTRASRQSTSTAATFLTQGLQSILINQFGCEELHGRPWVSKEMRAEIVKWLKDRQDGKKVGSLPKTLEKAGFKRYSKLFRTEGSPTKCFMCGGEGTDDNGLMLAGKQYRLCANDAPKFMVAMDEVLEKMK